jgi:hypothetical protein
VSVGAAAAVFECFTPTLVFVAGALLCGACDVVCALPVVWNGIEYEKEKIGGTLKLWCASGSATATTADGGAAKGAAPVATSVAAAAAHSVSVAIGARRPAARRRWRAGRLVRDTGRTPDRI